MAMRIRKLSTLLLAVVAASATLVNAAELKVGDPAPPLSSAKWVKGEPVKAIEEGKIYVVEFWATWCGPCRATIPHLSDLQKKYPDVVFIGQNVWERDDALIEPFVKEMGEKMSYRVATDDKSGGGPGKMAATWMEAAGQNGIPATFIVNKDKTIAWIGHPGGMDKVLEMVVAGTFDAEAAKRTAAQDAEKQAAMEAVGAAFKAKVGPFLEKQDFAGAAGAVDSLIAVHPAAKRELLGVKFGVLIEGKQYDAAYATADQVAADANDEPVVLNALASAIVDQAGIEQRDLDRAQKYAARAVELTQSKEASLLETLARVHADKGETQKAVEVQIKAVAAATGDEKAAMQKTLETYQAKVK
jgi:thiol-disulfide isomerase/thioredoxin